MVFGIAHIWVILLLTGLVFNYNVVLSRRDDKFDIQLIALPHSKTRMNARQTAAHIFAITRTNVCINVYIETNISQASSDKDNHSQKSTQPRGEAEATECRG